MVYYKYGGVFVNEASNGFSETPTIKNLYDPSTCIIGNLNTNGTINSKNGNCATTDFIPVTAGKVFSAGYLQETVRNPLITLIKWREYCMTYQFYSADKSTIVASGGLTWTENTANGVTVPSGASWVRVSWNSYGGSDYFYPNQTPEKCFVTCSDSAPTKPLYYECNDGYTQETAESALYGQTLTIFGDSYSDSWGGHSWDAREVTAASQGGTAANNTPWSGRLFWSKACAEFGLTVDNRAKGGTNLPYGSSSYEQWNGMDKVKALIEEVKSGATAPKFLVLQFGTNCWESQVGTVNDAASADARTYPSAYKWVIDTIRTELPETNIGVMLPLTVNDPPHRFNAHDVLLSVLQTDAYKDIPYIDMAAVSGLVYADLPDGVHPSSKKANTVYANWARVLLMRMIAEQV